MRNTLCAAALLSIALLGAGCKKSPSIVGKWTGNMQSQVGEFEFKPDNTVVISAKQGPITIAFNGDYKLEGESITITLKDVKIDGAPKNLEEMVKSTVKNQVGKPQTSQIKFVSEDEVSLALKQPAGAAASSTPQAITLKRVKEGA